ncbi:MAG: BLUF domain-containing protein [Psychrobacter sp.]|uniref:BLUF domain-containing protein n=1 Tax=Psychrobacter sp. AOP7-B1-24 TaxID=3457645 RepID=UPI003FBA26E6
MSTINDSTNPVTTGLCQFVYISKITSTGLSSPSTLNDISEGSIARNRADNITGILCYGNGYFLQYIEGSEQDLTNLKNRLLVDGRHKELQILDFSEISKRRFTDWSLRSVTLERWMMKEPELKKFMPFQPYEWAPNEWPAFLDILQGYYEEQVRIGNIDTPPIKYSTLGVTLSKVIGQHQAFFLIQTVLGLMIILTVLWLVLSDKV